MTFPVKAMSEVGGRPIFAALHLLLSEERLFSLPEKQRLPAILDLSRKYQNQVTEQLAGQVLAALYELLRGFQAADEHRRGELLREALREDPDHVYAGLLTVLLRLVFTLYAEERGLLSNDPIYVNHYAITGLFERLRADAGRYPDTMDQRYGAWAQLLSLFRLIHDGGGHAGFRLPPRHGHLFNPDRYNFLEGRPWRVGRVMGERIDPPMVPDGVVFRVLENLMVLDGERLSYRTLNVEQIGSVYETMMGFHLEVARGRSIAIKPAKPHGAPATINLDEILQVAPDKRAGWVRERTDQTVEGASLEPLKAARTPEDLVAALSRKVAREATPSIVPAGAMVLQPSDERRRSGFHYTPSTLTEPIVRTALRPILERLGERPTPDQVLGLKVCDPAMGSGAFLVEACRQLGDALVKAWHSHACPPPIPPDEDEHLHARRLVAQRCLYGVDKNPMAVDLAKLSLWLETLARDHAFTFLDHALRHGDSLVGLTRDQIGSFHWTPAPQTDLFHAFIEKRVKEAMDLRGKIQAAGEGLDENELRMLLKEADEALADVRLVGDLVIAAFFGGEKPRDREGIRKDLQGKVEGWLSRGQGKEGLGGIAEGLREQDRPIAPFHWEIEFPEVFNRKNPGFDAMVGNPPFLGGTKISTNFGDTYLAWLLATHAESHGNADMVAHFYRRAFTLLRQEGCFGLIATNTIGQGDTRSTGLRWICTYGGTIYSARKRLKWPGEAAVVVSVVHVKKGEMTGPFELDGQTVPTITAYLFHAGGHENPASLRSNENKSFTGAKIYGQGFTFDDTDRKDIASPLAEMHRLITKDPRNIERVFPYIGGEEVNDHPEHKHHRYTINFADFPLRRADVGISWVEASDKQREALLRSGIVPLDYPEPVAADWPDLLAIVENKVKPERMRLRRTTDAIRLIEKWWLFGRSRPELQAATRDLERVLVINCGATPHMSFAFMKSQFVFAHSLAIFALDTYSAFCILQSRVHEVWARLCGSSMKDDLRYTPSDCFETILVKLSETC